MRKLIPSKPKIAIIASEGARDDPSSPLLRFIRDYAKVLKKFDIYTTAGTGNAICASGLYNLDEVAWHRSGPMGGVVELAAMVARMQVGTVIFLSDPLDIRSDVPENFALQRVCREIGVRLISTLASAEEWALCGGKSEIPKYSPFPSNWDERGNKNVDNTGEPLFLSIPEQTIALISHDRKKDEMIDFVNEHLDFLDDFHRILTTGTTGWLLKLLYAGENQKKEIEAEAELRLGAQRFGQLKEMLWSARLRHAKADKRESVEENALAELGQKIFDEIQKETSVINEDNPKPLEDPNPNFVSKVMPLPSGPKGGDILIADEILNHRCHRIIFFIDPGTAHAHEPDIRLLERTCQIRGVYAVCTSDRKSSHDSIARLGECYEGYILKPCTRHKICQKYKLREAIIVDTNEDVDGKKLGKALSRACAGYLFQQLMWTVGEDEIIRVGIAHGWVMRQVLKEMIGMEKGELLRKPSKLSGRVIWSPIIGNLTVEWTDREAAAIANDFKGYFGGEVEAFQSSGLRHAGTKSSLSAEDNALIHELAEAKIILASAAPWNKEATLFKNTALKTEYFPKFTDAAGVISAIFLDENGKEAESQYSVVGLDYKGFHRAAKRGAVVLMCGGKNHRKIALAALRAGLVSVLITTNATADFLLEEKATTSTSS